MVVIYFKNKGKWIVFIICALLSGASNGQIWPFLNIPPQNQLPHVVHKVGLSYNSYELASNFNSTFHSAIDVLVESNKDFVIAPEDGEIYRIDVNYVGEIVIYFKSITNRVYVFGHCVKASMLPNLYTGIPGQGNFFTHILPWHLPQGSVLATSNNFSLPSQYPSYNHIHFMFFDAFNLVSVNFPFNALNPLDQSFASSHTDPNPNTNPVLGIMLIKKIGSFNFPYLKCNSQNINLVNGDIQFEREIYDDMGYNSGIEYSLSSISACIIPPNSMLTNGLIGAPYKIEYALKNFNGQLKDGPRELTFNSHPLSNPEQELLFSDQYSFNEQSIKTKTIYCLNNLPLTGTSLIYDNYLRTRSQIGNVGNLGVSACLNDEAEFKDGIYTVEVSAWDKDQNYQSDLQEVHIDNFKPYVKNVVVNAIETNSSGQVMNHEIYRAGWIWTAQRKLELTPAYQNDRLNGQYKPGAGNLIQINVTFSEIMDPNEVRLSLRSNCIYLDPTTTSQTVGSPTTQDNKTFVFTIEDQNLILAHSELQTIEIFGKDIVGSELLGFSESTTHGLIDADELSYRSPDGLSWVNDDFGVSNMDNTHHFSIQGCFDPNRRLTNGTISDGPMSTGCLIADFSGSSNDPFPTTISVFEFIDQSTLGSNPAAVNYYWDFGDAQFSSLQNPSHIYSSPGIYDVTLTISDGNDTDTKTKHSYIVVNASGASLVPDFSIIPNVGLNVGDQISILNSTSGGSGTVSYEWTLDGCNPSSSNSVSPQAITITASGQHTISLKVYDDNNLNGLSISKTFSASQNGNISPLNASITNDLPQGNSYQFHANISGGNPPYSSFWDFGDGSGSSDPNPSHNFLPGHQYTVQLEVYDVGGGLINRNSIIQTSSQGGVTDLDFFADQTYFTSCPAMVNLHATYHSPDPFATNIQWTIIQTDVSPHILAGPFGGDNIAQYLPTGVYDVEVTATYNGIVSSPVRKTAYLQLCQPDPTLFEVTRFDLVKNCLGTSFNIDVRNGIGFPIGDPATSSTDYLTLLKFGIDIHTTFQGTVNNLALSNRPGYLMVYTLESTSSSNTFPKTVTYTLKVYENNVVNGVYNHITYTKSFVFPSSCLIESDINVGTTSLSLCPGKSIILGGAPVLAPDIGVPPISYHWDVTAGTLSNPADRPNPIYTAPGGNTTATATLTVSDGSGMSFSKSLFINVTPISVNAGPDLNICVHNSVSVTNVNVIGGSGTYSYLWTPSAGISCQTCITPNITLPNAGPTSYVLNVIDNLGCTAQDQIVVNASNVFPQLSNIPDQYTCPGKSVLLDGQVVSSGQSFVYEWLGGDLYFENQLEDALVSPFSTTQYTFHVTDPLYGCTSAKDVMVFVDESQGPNDLEIEFPLLATDQINGQAIYPCNTFFEDGQQQVNYQTIKINASTSQIQFDWYLSYNRFDASTFLSSDKSLNLPWTQNEFLTGIVTNQDGCKAKKEIQIIPDLITYKATDPQYGLINQLFDVKCEVTNQIGYTSRWGVGNLETSTNVNEFGDINSVSTTFTPTDFYWPFGVARYLWNYVDNGHGCRVQIPAQVINVYEPNNNFYYPESMLQYNNFDGLTINSPCAGIAGNGNSPLNYNCFSLQGSPFTFKENPYFLSSVATSRGFKIGQQIEPWTSFITHMINPNNTAWDFNSPNCGYNNQPGVGTLDLFFDLPWNHSFYLTANLEYYPVLGVLPHINVCNAPSPLMLHKYWASEIGYYGYPGLDIYAMNIDIGAPLNSFYCDGDFISENSTDIQGNKNLRIFAGNEININPGNYIYTGFNATAGVGGGEFYAGINECLFQFPARIRNPILSRSSYTDALNSKPSITGLDVLSVYPNPTSDLINVEFSLPQEQKIILEIANQYGSPIANIVTGTYKDFKIVVSADQLSLKPAVYFVILKTHGQTFAKRFSIVK